MNEESRQQDITKKSVVYEMPHMKAVPVKSDIEYSSAGAGALTLDLYSPPAAEDGELRPAVIFVAGFPDPGFERIVGCKFKEMKSYSSWGRLTAASGLVAVTYANREPLADLETLIRYLKQEGASLGIDGDRMAVWACSGNVPLALSVLMKEAEYAFRCAVLCYGFMLDREESGVVAKAASTFGFVNPNAGKTVNDLAPELPLFVARCGRDEMPGVNETIDGFLADGLVSNLPISFVNHALAPHAFDLLHDSDTSREVIRRILTFLRFHLMT